MSKSQKRANTACTPFRFAHEAGCLTCGMTNANALVLGDPIKLDERYSLEARSPDLRHFHLCPLAPPAHLPRTQVRGGQVCGKVQASIVHARLHAGTPPRAPRSKRGTSGAGPWESVKGKPQPRHKPCPD